MMSINLRKCRIDPRSASNRIFNIQISRNRNQRNRSEFWISRSNNDCIRQISTTMMTSSITNQCRIDITILISLHRSPNDIADYIDYALTRRRNHTLKIMSIGPNQQNHDPHTQQSNRSFPEKMRTKSRAMVLLSELSFLHLLKKEKLNGI